VQLDLPLVELRRERRYGRRRSAVAWGGSRLLLAIALALA